VPYKRLEGPQKPTELSPIHEMSTSQWVYLELITIANLGYTLGTLAQRIDPDTS